MPGIRIGVDVSGGVSSLAQFRQALKDSGAESKLTENEIKRLEERFQQKLQADKASSALNQFASAAGLSAKEAQALAGKLGVASDAAKRLTQSKEDLARSAGALDVKMKSMTGSIGSAVLKVGALATAYVSLREAMSGVKDFVDMGIGFNSSIESAQLGIASVLSATQNIADAEGRRLEGMDKLNAAQAISRDLMKDIQRMGLETTATTQELVDGFQALVGPATSAGLTLDQTKNTMVGIVQAFAALKIPMEQLSAESRSLFDGDIKLGQDRLAGVLGITKEMVLTWQKQGTYVENLNKKLEFFRLAGEESAKTWAGLASNTKEVLEVFAGSATQGLFTGAKQAMSEFAAFALDTKNAGLGGEMQQISAGMREIGEYLGKELVSLTREFIDYLKSASKDFDADEVRKKMEEIGKSAKETASAVGNVAVAVGKLLGTTLDGWNSLPESIRDIGLIAAIAGGAKIRAAIIGLSAAVGYVKELYQYAKNISTLDNPGAEAGIRKADFNIKRINDDIAAAKVATDALGNYDQDQRDRNVRILQNQLEFWKDYKKGALLGISKEQIARGEYSPGLASAEKMLAYDPSNEKQGYKVSPIVDKAKEQAEKEAKAYTDEYLKGWAKGTTNKKERAAREKDKAIWELMDDYNSGKYGKGEKGLERFNSLKGIIDNEYNAAIEATGKGGKGVVKADAEAVKLINEARGKALAAESSLLGDSWGQKEAQATTEYQKTLDDLNVKLAEYKGTQKEALVEGLKYWAEYEYGIKKAQIAYDAWKEDMTFWANNLKSVGQLSFDPSKTMAGETMDINQQTTDAQRQIDSRASAQARRIWDDAVEASRKDGADISAIWTGVNDKWLETEKKRLDQTEANNQEAELKKVDLREKTLGDLAKLDDAYQARREEGFKNLEKTLRDLGVSETRIAQEVSLKKDKDAKEFLGSRLQYEDSFSGYLSDALALEYGLYKSAYGRQLDAYKQFSDTIIKGVNEIADAFSDTFGDALGDAITGQFKGIENYINSLLSSLKQAFASFVSDMAKYAVRNYIVVPIVAKVVGTDASDVRSMLGMSASADQRQTGGGINGGTVLQGASAAKSAYSLFGPSGGSSAGWMDAATGNVYSLVNNAPMAWSDGAGGLFSMVDNTPVWMDSSGGLYSLANNTPVTAGSSVGLGSMASAGLMGAAGGYFTGQMLRPDNPSSSYAGAATGLGAGALAAYFGAGAWAGPIGLAAAAVAAAITAAVTPNTVSTRWNNMPGSQAAIQIVDGQLVPQSWGNLTQTSSGLGGSSTKHGIFFQPADEKLSAEETAAWEAATAGLTKFAEHLGVTDDQLSEFSKGFTTAPLDAVNFDAYSEFAAYLSQHIIDKMGLTGDISEVAQSGETTIQTLTRLASTMDSMDAIARNTGFSFDALTQGLTKIQGADYVSQLADAVGSIDAVQSAIGLLTKHTKSDAEILQAQIAQTSRQVGPDLAALGTDLESFWTSMQTAMTSGPLDPELFAAWAEAATTVDSIDTLTDSLKAAEAQADQTATSMRQLGLSLEARALTAQGLDWQASQVSLLAQQEAELAQARQAGYDAATLARIAEVQALETAAAIRAHQEEVDSTRASLLSRIASATGDAMYEITAMVTARNQEYLRLQRTLGEDLATLSNKAYNAEINAKLAAMAESKRLAEESFKYDIQARKLTLEGKDHEAGAVKLLAQQATEFRSAVASGLGAEDLATVLDVQRQELTKYWSDLVDDLKDAADAIHRTVVELRGGDQSPLLPDQKYAILRSRFDADLAKGLTGDRTAISEAQSLATSVLSAKMDSTTDPAEYTAVFNEIMSALGALADALLGQQQADTIAEAEATYQQAVQQATQMFETSLEGQITQALAYTGAGATAVYHLQDTNTPDGTPNWDAYLRSHPGEVGNFLEFYQTRYGYGGSGQYDAWEILSKLISLGVTPVGTGDLYQAALDALDNLKAVRGYATGGLVSTPQLAMVAENEPELIIPVSRLRSVGGSAGGDGNGVLAELRAVRAELAGLRRQVQQGQDAIASNTRRTVTILRTCGGDEGVLTMRAEQ